MPLGHADEQRRAPAGETKFAPQGVQDDAPLKLAAVPAAHVVHGDMPPLAGSVEDDPAWHWYELVVTVTVVCVDCARRLWRRGGRGKRAEAAAAALSPSTRAVPL